MKLALLCLCVTHAAAANPRLVLETQSGAATAIEWDGTDLTIPDHTDKIAALETAHDQLNSTLIATGAKVDALHTYVHTGVAAELAAIWQTLNHTDSGLAATRALVTDQTSGLAAAHTGVSSNARSIAGNDADITTLSGAVNHGTTGLAATRALVTDQTSGLAAAHTGVSSNARSIAGNDADISTNVQGIAQNQGAATQAVNYLDNSPLAHHVKGAHLCADGTVVSDTNGLHSCSCDAGFAGGGAWQSGSADYPQCTACSGANEYQNEQGQATCKTATSCADASVVQDQDRSDTTDRTCKCAAGWAGYDATTTPATPTCTTQCTGANEYQNEQGQATCKTAKSCADASVVQDQDRSDTTDRTCKCAAGYADYDDAMNTCSACMGQSQYSDVTGRATCLICADGHRGAPAAGLPTNGPHTSCDDDTCERPVANLPTGSEVDTNACPSNGLMADVDGTSNAASTCALKCSSGYTQSGLATSYTCAAVTGAVTAAYAGGSITCDPTTCGSLPSTNSHEYIGTKSSSTQCLSSCGMGNCWQCKAGYTGANCDAITCGSLPSTTSHEYIGTKSSSTQCLSSCGMGNCWQCKAGYTGANCDAITCGNAPTGQRFLTGKNANTACFNDCSGCHTQELTVPTATASGMASSWSCIQNNRLCYKQSTSALGIWDALDKCRGMGARVCEHADMGELCANGKSPASHSSTGWFGDHGNDGNDWDDEYGTWNSGMQSCDADTDATPTSSGSRHFVCCMGGDPAADVVAGTQEWLDSDFTNMVSQQHDVGASALQSASNGWDAILTCRNMGGHVCTHNDMFQVSSGNSGTNNPWSGASEGWYGDHGRASGGDWDDEYGTWNVNSYTSNNDGPAKHAGNENLPFRCCGYPAYDNCPSGYTKGTDTCYKRVSQNKDAHDAITYCMNENTHLCMHIDMQALCGQDQNPYSHASNGWYGDKARANSVETSTSIWRRRRRPGDWDNEFGTWNSNQCTTSANNDGPAEHEDRPTQDGLKFACCTHPWPDAP